MQTLQTMDDGQKHCTVVFIVDFEYCFAFKKLKT